MKRIAIFYRNERGQKMYLTADGQTFSGFYPDAQEHWLTQFDAIKAGCALASLHTLQYDIIVG